MIMRNVSYARQIVLSATVREANRIIFCFPHAIVLRGSYSYLLWPAGAPLDYMIELGFGFGFGLEREPLIPLALTL
jgi:hypothetical protein